MKHSTLITVIIPLYNKEQWVKRALDSVLAQTYENLEILVVNDGSTDGSWEVVAAYSDERIRIIDKQNGGVSSARNLGIEKAKGEYIAFLDADDKWYPKYLEVLADGFEKYPDASILSNRLVYRHDGEEEFETETKEAVSYETLDFIKTLSKGEFPIHIGSTLFKTSLLYDKALRFNESMRLAEDVNFMLRVSRYGKVILSDYTGLVYFQDDAQSAMKQQSQHAALVPHYFEGMEKEPWSGSEEKQIRKFLFREYLKKAYQNRRLPWRREEWSCHVGGGSLEIPSMSRIPYVAIRYTPEFIYGIYRKIKTMR